MDESKYKKVIVNACYLEESESKSVHISINTKKVKYSTNETNDEEPSITDNSVFICANLF